MDGLDVYIDDYSKPDPIPDSMLRKLAHAKGLLFDEKEEPQEPEDKAAQAPPEALPDATPDSVPAAPSEKKDKV